MKISIEGCTKPAMQQKFSQSIVIEFSRCVFLKQRAFILKDSKKEMLLWNWESIASTTSLNQFFTWNCGGEEKYTFVKLILFLFEKICLTEKRTQIYIKA